MRSLYFYLPTLLYFLLLIVIPVILLLKFFTVRNKNSFTLLLSAVLGMAICILTFIISIAPHYGILMEQVSYLKKYLLVSTPFVLILFIVGAMQKTSGQQQKRLVVIVGSLLILLPLLAFGLIIITSQK